MFRKMQRDVRSESSMDSLSDCCSLRVNVRTWRVVLASRRASLTSTYNKAISWFVTNGSTKSASGSGVIKVMSHPGSGPSPGIS